MTFETPKVRELPPPHVEAGHDPFIDGLENESVAAVRGGEKMTREQTIAAVGQMAREAAMPAEVQQHVIAEQEQRELAHH